MMDDHATEVVLAIWKAACDAERTARDARPYSAANPGIDHDRIKLFQASANHAHFAPNSKLRGVFGACSAGMRVCPALYGAVLPD
jgi:hypothetical protein